MMVTAARRLGLETIVLDPTPNSPAGQVASQQLIGGFRDAARIRELVSKCDVVTYDLEDVDVVTLAELEAQGHSIYPSPSLVAVIQNKLHQKQRLEAAGLPTSPFIPMDKPTRAAFAEFGYPLVQKAAVGGYDGRGVAILKCEEDFDSHLPVTGLVEKFIPAEMEIAVLVARSRDGYCKSYPPVEMRFRSAQNVLDMLIAPARISPKIDRAARELALKTVTELDGVGVVAVEMFLADGELLINEIAPRTHNSGHHTIEAAVTDQFEQHVRAVVGLPLGSTELLSPATMINLLGAAGRRGTPTIAGMGEALAVPGVSVHLYGKAECKPFRKMGHVTVVDSDLDQAIRKAENVRDLLVIAGEAEA